ncbi:MAG TPA: hypothetical protein DIU20_10495 [Cryomorphaceae bacterium]|nr:hypothetical protein [Cryomorphaceae bacterium]
MDEQERSPEFDFFNGVGVQQNVDGEVQRYPFRANMTLSEKSSFYIDKIESDREWLVFFKGIREDEFAQASGAANKIPSLRLEKVVRYFKNGTTLNKNNSVNVPDAAFSTINNSPYSTNYRNKAFFSADYNAAPNSDNILSGVEFVYDYSLVPSYDKNIVNLNGVGTLQPFGKYANQSSVPDVYVKPTLTNNHGKLTLVQLKLKEKGFQQVFDPYIFTYGSTTLLNPSFGHNDQDYSGYYNDLGSHRRQLKYNTHTENTNVAGTWALKGITFPNKTFLEINYDFDQYRYSHESYVGNSRVVPITDYTIDAFSASYITQKGSITFTADLPSPEDYQFLQAKTGRTVILHFGMRHNFQCSGDAGLVKVYGHGAEPGTSGFTFSQNTSTGKVVVTAPVVVDDEPTTSCYGNISLTNLSNREDRYAYFEIKENNKAVGSIRVKNLKVYENDASSEFYEIGFNYSDAMATGSPYDIYLTPTHQVSFGNMNTDLNSVPFDVLYENVEIEKKGLDGSLLSRGKLKFRMNKPISGYRANSEGKEDKCFLPQQYLEISVSTYWRMLHHEDFDETTFPEIVECAVYSYINDYWLPANSSFQDEYDSGDWEAVANALPGIPLIDLPGCGTTTNGEGQLYCSGRGGVQCGNYYVKANTDPSQSDYYQFYTKSDHGTRKYHTRVIDRSSQFGKPYKVETFDKDGNLVLSTEYVYDVKAFNQNYYSCTFGKSTVVDNPSTGFQNNFATDYLVYYYYPKRKITISKGMEYVEEIIDLDPLTGKPSLINYLDPSKGLTQEVKEYPGMSTHSFGGHLKARTMIAHWAEAGNVGKDQIVWAKKNGNGIVTTSAGHGEMYVTKWNASQERDNHDVSKNIIQPLDGVENRLYGLTYNAQSNDPTTNYVLNFSTNMLSYFSCGSGESLIRVSFDNSTSAYNYVVETLYDQTEFIPHALKVIRGEYISNWSETASTQVTYLSGDNKDLEVYDNISNIYSSSCYRLNRHWPLASVKNCRLGSFTATGFEDQQTGNPYFEGKVTGSSNRVEPIVTGISGFTKAHTGKYVCKLGSGSPEVAFSTDPEVAGGVLEAGRTYVTSVWVYNASYSGAPGLSVALNGSLDGGSTAYDNEWSRDITDQDNLTVGDWTLVEIEFEVPSTYTAANPSGTGASGAYNELKIKLVGGTGNVYFDDFRFHPVDVPLEVSIQDEITGRKTHVLDANNMYTEMIYDAAGRVTRTNRESVYGVFKQQETTYNH